VSMHEKLLDSKDVARILNIKPETVRWYHKNGLMPKADFKFGNSLVWKESTISEWRSED
jgi:DNA-binding transcriptional MerR regulator